MLRRSRPRTTSTDTVAAPTGVDPGEGSRRPTTALITLADGVIAEVDDQGVLLAREAGTTTGRAMPGAPSVQWWVGAEDGWHLPDGGTPRVVTRAEAAPVVSTAAAVPGGPVTGRTWAVVVDGEPVTALFCHNGSATPVGLALVVTVSGADSAVRLEGDTVFVEVGGARTALLRLDRRPAAVAAGDLATVREVVTGGRAGAPDEASTLVASGPDATVALVVPLAHSATVRAVLGSVTGAERLPAPVDLPGVDRAEAGWAAVIGGGTRLVLPDHTLAGLHLRHRTRVLAAGRPGPGGPALPGDTGMPSAAASAAVLCEAAVRFGAATAVAESLPALVERLLGTEVVQADGSRGAAAAAWVAVAAQGLVWNGAALDRRAQRAIRELARDAAVTLGARLGGLDVVDEVEARGLVAALPRLAATLDGVGESSAARDLLTAWPAALERFPGPMVGEHESGSVALLAAAAGACARRGDGDQALALLRRAARAASATGTWTDRWVGQGPAERAEVLVTGDDPAASAAFVTALVDLVAAERPDGVAVLPALPTAWWQREVEAHGLETVWGRLSFGVRWHGERPVLMWELAPVPVDRPVPGPFRIMAPSLAEGWSSSDTEGNLMFPDVPRPAGSPGWVAIEGEGVTTTGLGIGRRTTEG